MKKLSLEKIVWVLYALVSAIALYVWGVQLEWSADRLNSYTIFPLLGLLAFSLMWVHYVSGFIRDRWFPAENTKRSFSITSYLVLALILLHPTVLVVQLFLDGFGVPPASYKQYVGEAGFIWVILGTLGLSGLLLFEGKRWFSKKSWWKYANVINDIAVLFIAIHSLRLGRHLQSGWFLYLWYFYIITIVLCIIRGYYKKLPKN